ncbi:DUF2806 domain-containing protein [Synechococcus elongatus]|uniref:DUF2806 domain-containing protein n=1 Tax=Synechococcus elongatus PCC 11801 TaxID=2219813 RepID=A0AAN1QLQ2_SYNEL|nr:DUF2806 domain-containing protein [Synechococcus elongatus]AZB71665.1 hypothetical protein DOP62_02070 [Synechococcus elongatus PCC 11801]
MSNWLTPISETAKSTLNIIKSIGPLLISQSNFASEAYARHLLRLASVEAAKELVNQEIDIYSKAKEQLIQRYIDADQVERIRIKRDLEDIESNVRSLNIAATAMNYLSLEQNSAEKVSDSQETSSLDQKEISPHWLDKFNELSRSRNEDWRANLLSCALAVESRRPGTVSPRALWLLGTLEEPIFKAFATILDLSSFIGSGLMIPDSEVTLLQKPVPNCELGDTVSIGRLVYLLSDIGVLAESLTTQRSFPQGSKFSVKYHSFHYCIECLSNPLTVEGVILTPLGSSLASFYSRNFNPLGAEIFQAWINSLDRNHFLVTKL